MPLAPVNGVELNYRIDDLTLPWIDKSEVKYILTHHAYFRGLESLTGWVPTLARHYRVVRFDSRGFGGSSAPPEPFEMTIPTLSQDALALMDHLGVEKFHFLGMNSGGIAGQILAAEHPHRVLSLTLCDTPHRLNDPIRKRLSLGFGSISGAIRQLGFKEWRSRTLNSTLNPAQIDPRMTAWQVAMQERVPLHINIAQQKSLEESDTAPILKDIRCPTLLIGGDRSEFMPLEMITFMMREIPDAQAKIFPGVGSTVGITRAEECAGVMLDFLRQIDGKADWAVPFAPSCQT